VSRLQGEMGPVPLGMAGQDWIEAT
jgi:hypothetical protein